MEQTVDNSYRRYFPMLVNETGGVEDMPDDVLLALWRELDNLPEEKQRLLLSEEMGAALKEAEQQLSLTPDTIGFVSLCVRHMVMGKMSPAQAEAKLGGALTATGGGNPNQAGAIVKYIQEKILTLTPAPEPAEETIASPSVAAIGTPLTLPLLEALARYPQLAQQTITTGRVVLRGASEGVRGSLQNWIKCYREELGVGYHDAIKRGEFLFQSKNGKPLPPGERERVSLILRSIEDGEPIEVDPTRQEIQFPAREVPANISLPPMGQAGVTFTSKNVFPAEKGTPLAPQKAQPRSPGPSFGVSEKGEAQRFNPFRIDPVSQRTRNDKAQYGE